MKKMFPIISSLLAALFLLAAFAASALGRAEECLRLHVIANSDSAEDQAVKLKVRDAILEYAREDLEAEDRASAERELLSSGGDLQEAAECALRENGADYGAELFFGEFNFPDRAYQNRFYPEGRYEALRVVLGEGEGHNWWCVMFPPLCVIETEDQPAEFNEDGTLVFKSFIFDLVREVFGG